MTTKFESMLEAAPDAMVGVDQGGVIQFVNRQTELLFGYDRNDLVGQPIETLVPESFRTVHPAHRAEYFADPGTRAMGAGLELTGLRRDGTEFPVDISLSSIETEAGPLVTAAVRDITDRKRTEGLLEAARQDIDRFFSLSLDLLVIASTDGLFKRVNPAWTDVLGYDTGELLGQPFANFIHPDDLEAAAAEITRLMAGETSVAFENRYRCKDGSYRWLLWKVAPFPGQGLMYAVARDNTDRRRIEAKFESLLEAAPDAMVGVDQSGVIRFVNRQTELLFGYDRGDLVGHPIETLVPESFRKVHPAHRAGYFADPGTRAMGAGLELTGRRKDGTTFPVDISLSSIETEDGLLVTAAVRNVADRKKADQDLLRMAAIIEYSDDAIIGKTLDGTVTSWNPAAERMYGYSAEEIIGKSIMLVIPEDRSGEMGVILDKIREDQPTQHYETVRIRKDATPFQVSLTVSPIHGPDGAIIGASTIAHDVSQQKQAFDAARSMIEASLDSLVSISPEGKITDVNEATTKATGVPRDKLIGTAFSDYFTEPDKANAVYQQVFAEGMAVDYPLTIRRPDGALTDVLYNASVYRDAKGQVLGVFAAARDVTAQNRAQVEIAEQLGREQERLAELERFQRLTVGRELKMIELKKEIERLRRFAPGGGGDVVDER